MHLLCPHIIISSGLSAEVCSNISIAVSTSSLLHYFSAATATATQAVQCLMFLILQYSSIFLIKE